MVGEVLEARGHGRLADSIRWAQVELEEPINKNPASKARAGRLLGRCHAARGEHALSVSALNSALEAAKTGELLLSEALVMREKSRLG